MRIVVEYFGPAQTWAGSREDVFEVAAGADLAALIPTMVEKRPGLANRTTVLRFAINESFADPRRALVDGDRVAVIPPVSGGVDDDLIALVNGPIDIEAVRRHVGGDPSVGGIAWFDGVTRFERHETFGGLLRLEYEVYENMAISQMRLLAAEARRRWGVSRLAIVHRVGPVDIGQTSVTIAVACGHRAEAFDACRYLIDTLKKDVPIWKREVWQNGPTTWVDPTKSE